MPTKPPSSIHASNPKRVPQWSCDAQGCCNPESIPLCEELDSQGFSLPSYHHFLLEAPQHLLQLQLVFAVQLGLVPVLLLLQETQLPQLLAPAEGQGDREMQSQARSEGGDGQRGSQAQAEHLSREWKQHLHPTAPCPGFEHRQEGDPSCLTCSRRWDAAGSRILLMGTAGKPSASTGKASQHPQLLKQGLAKLLR